MSSKFIKHPLEAVHVGQIVKVWVLEVDLKKGRLQLTMIDPNAPKQEEQKVKQPKPQFNKPKPQNRKPQVDPEAEKQRRQREEQKAKRDEYRRRQEERFEKQMQALKSRFGN
jgi:transcriptional accessory protein Tex/SPT6